jgi:F-type H+-transporting ATPase subunit b
MILEILGKIGFDWQVALANLVNFLIIVWLIKRFFFAPMKKAVEERRAKIQEGVEKATEAETTLFVAKEKGKSIVVEAQTQAQLIAQSAKENGDALIDSAKEKAEQEASVILAKAKKKSEAEFFAREQEFKARSAGVIVDAVGKLLQEEMTPSLDKKLQTRALEMMRQ